ncbi:RrF2 family transcriptional regulator [Herbaspirillum chlorophenolicum]|uniref:RrF2 family transcriptional regulator n=1 Tax=Herbaspirillum chlorophenolicum TaxID=211589 RepID=A0ABW8F0P1_9BURK|nr:Rrf2 family transcriptional regulator [Herbaspirillum chlorophenolicum]
MQLDTRLARLLHVLIHMHLREGTTTSDTIAQMLHTNPVIVRRTMAAIREAGYVSSTGGPGGGWRLERAISDITVRDVYQAITRSSLFAVGLTQDNPHCPVEASVNKHLRAALNAAERTLIQQLGALRLSDIAEEVGRD